MKELIWVRVQYASRHQCCKTHKRPLPLPYTAFYSSIRKAVEIRAPLEFYTAQISFTPRRKPEVMHRKAVVKTEMNLQGAEKEAVFFTV